MATVDFKTAHKDWDQRWQSQDGNDEWRQPATFVTRQLELLQQRDVQRVADVGCGLGRHALWLAQQGFDVLATDGSSAGLNSCAQEASYLNVNIKTAECGFDQIPVDNNDLDYILSFNVIYHGTGPDVTQALTEFHRALKPGGLLQLTMLSKWCDHAKVAH